MALDGAIGARAGRTVQRERRHGQLLRRLRGEELRHARLEVAALGAVLHRRRPVGEETRGVEPGRHVRERGRRLGGRSRQVRERVVVRRLGHADGAGGDVDPARLETAHHVLEAAALDTPDEVRRRHRAVLEEELGRVHALVAELREGLDDSEAGVTLLDDEARHAAMARLGRRVGQREEGERVALAAVGHEHLRPRNHVLASGPARHGPDGLHIRARVRLGEAQAAPRLAAREAGEEAPALLLGAVVEDDQRGHRVAVDHAGERHEAAAQRLDDPGVRRDVEPEPAVGRGHEGAEETEVAHARDELVGVAVGVLERRGARAHLALDELADGRDERVTRAGQTSGHGGSILQ